MARKRIKGSRPGMPWMTNMSFNEKKIASIGLSVFVITPPP